MLENVYEVLNAQKCIWKLECSKMYMKASMIKNVCDGLNVKNVYEVLNAQKCIWRLKCSKMYMKASMIKNACDG